MSGHDVGASFNTHIPGNNEGELMTLVILLYGGPIILCGVGLGMHAHAEWHWQLVSCIFLGAAPVALVGFLVEVSRLLRLLLMFSETFAGAAFTFQWVSHRPGWDAIWGGAAGVVVLIVGLAITYGCCSGRSKPK